MNLQCAVLTLDPQEAWPDFGCFERSVEHFVYVARRGQFHEDFRHTLDRCVTLQQDAGQRRIL